MTTVHYPTHPAMEKAILECAEAAKQMQVVEDYETTGRYLPDEYREKAEVRWERALVSLTESARRAGKNTQKRGPSASSVLYTQVDS